MSDTNPPCDPSPLLLHVTRVDGEITEIDRETPLQMIGPVDVFALDGQYLGTAAEVRVREAVYRKPKGKTPP